MSKIFFSILSALIILCCITSCQKFSVFPDDHSEDHSLSTIKSSSAVYLWVGPQYKVALSALVEDTDGISKIRIQNSEWNLDTTFTIDNQTSYAFSDSLLVSKDAAPTEHIIDFTVTNSKGYFAKTKITVSDSSKINTDPNYHADLLPPVITVAKPTIALTKFYGIPGENPKLDVDATITDDQIASIEMRVWGETADGTPVSFEDIITPATAAEKQSYHFTKTYTFPDGVVGKYQYVLRIMDASGNKSIKGGDITVGYVDRLYLSDAENQDEVINQGVDQGGWCYGIGTLLSMKRQSENLFTLDYYYDGSVNSKITFVATMGTKPINVNGQGIILNQLNYSNLFGTSAADFGKITGDQTAASNKLPVTQKGYYRITINMTSRTITAVPYIPQVDFSNAVKYPNWNTSGPWEYLAVTSTCIIGNQAWSETAANTVTTPKLMRDADNPYLFYGTFRVNVNSATNIQLSSPMASGAAGWFRLPSSRASMKDDYGDAISKVDAVGAQSSGANWGFSVVNPSGKSTGTFKASYNLVTKRLRIVRTGD